jgi:tetratricopeptide (TPR) repeat protein
LLIASTILLATTLGACASAPQRSMATIVHPHAAPVRVEDDAMLALLAGQFALQDNDLADAARHYAHAARLVGDPRVAEQATRLALAVKDWKLARDSLARWQQLAPEAAALAQARAAIALGSGDEDAAGEELAALALRGGADSWRLIAQALLAAGDKAMATRVLGRLAGTHAFGDEEGVWLAISQLAWKLGDEDLAGRLARKAIDRFHGADAYAWGAHLALERGDPAAARSDYLAALERHPDNLRLRTGYALLLSRDGDNRAAARALAAGPQSDATYAGRAAYAARAEDKAALNDLYRDILADTSERGDDRFYLLGQVAELTGRPDAALDWYARVSDADEHWFDARVRRIVVLDQLGRTGDAFAAVRVLQAQSATDSEWLGNAYLLEADLLARKGRRDEALAIHGRALVNLPDDPRILYSRALLLAETGDIAGAERDLRRVIDLDPENAEALNALGYTLADRTGRTREALALIERAARLKPDEAAIIDSLGWARYRLGDLDAAAADLRRAFAKQPDAEIAAHLGEVLWVMGRRDEAREIWEQGRRNDASNKALIETIRRLTT